MPEAEAWAAASAAWASASSCSAVATAGTGVGHGLRRLLRVLPRLREVAAGILDVTDRGCRGVEDVAVAVDGRDVRRARRAELGRGGLRGGLRLGQGLLLGGHRGLRRLERRVLGRRRCTRSGPGAGCRSRRVRRVGCRQWDRGRGFGCMGVFLSGVRLPWRAADVGVADVGRVWVWAEAAAAASSRVPGRAAGVPAHDDGHRDPGQAEDGHQPGGGLQPVGERLARGKPVSRARGGERAVDGGGQRGRHRRADVARHVRHPGCRPDLLDGDARRSRPTTPDRWTSPSPPRSR